jgi:hypothetical protein
VVVGSHAPQIMHTWLVAGNVVGLLAARAWSDTRVIITQTTGRGEEIFLKTGLKVQRALLGRADHAISNSSEGAEALEALHAATQDIGGDQRHFASNRPPLRLCDDSSRLE